MDIWAGVVRVSHVGGRSGDAFHADREQVDVLEAHVKAIGGRLVLLAPEMDVSGGSKLEDRPSLLAAVEGVERGEYAGIVVSYLSRLGRSVREQLRAWDRVEAAGGRIIVVREGIDTSTPTGRLQRTIMLGIAEHELELHAERFENLRKWATEAGIWQRRQTPRGYRRDEDTRKLVPDDRAGEVRQAFRDRAAGVPLVQIAQRLGMSNQGARALLANRVYLGELRVGQHVNVEAHPALVDEELFESAQTNGPRQPRRKDLGVALLAGLVRCAGCGHVMTRGGNVRWPVYGCPVHHSGERCPEPAVISERLLDAHVEEIALDAMRAMRPKGNAGDGVVEARARLKSAQGELEQYLAAVSVQDVGAEAFAGGAKHRQTGVQDARDALEREMGLRPVSPVLVDPVGLWAGLEMHERNRVLRGLVECVVVVRAGGAGAKMPVAERARVVAFGTGVPVARGVGGVAAGIVPIRVDDIDGDRVLRVSGLKDVL